MEVSGRAKSNQTDGIGDILCQPCLGDGDNEPAEGYCETCNEYFCSSCLKVHRKQSVSKNHVIKSKDEMPLVQIQTDTCSELCAAHKTEIVKFYCQEHNSVGCGDCMVLQHKSCHVQLVPDVSGNCDTSGELQDIKQMVKDLREEIEALKHGINRNLKAAEVVKDQVLAEIKLFRREINSYLDSVEADLFRDVEQLHDKDVSQQSQFLNECETIENEMKEFQNKLYQHSDKINKLFVTAKQAQAKLRGCQQVTKEIVSKSQINFYKFTQCKDMAAMKTSHTPMGNITIQNQKLAAQNKTADLKACYVKKLTVRVQDESSCFITGLAMVSCDEILLADYFNCSLKSLNVRRNAITTVYEPPCKPWDLTVINYDTAAVTFPDEDKIFLVNYRKRLSEYILKVRKGGRGIDYRNGVIAVSFCKPPAVQILNMKGEILHEVNSAGSLFTYPCYVSFSNENNIFVSDCSNSAVYELTMDGQLIKKIECKNQKPRGLMVTSNGTVIFCGENDRDKMNIILPDTRVVLPLYIQDVQQQFSISICGDSSTMFICQHPKSAESNSIKMYELR